MNKALKYLTSEQVGVANGVINSFMNRKVDEPYTYNKDWNAIIPVVEKIKIAFGSYDSNDDQVIRIGSTINVALQAVNIETLWFAVSDAIKYLNTPRKIEIVDVRMLFLYPGHLKEGVTKDIHDITIEDFHMREEFARKPEIIVYTDEHQLNKILKSKWTHDGFIGEDPRFERYCGGCGELKEKGGCPKCTSK